ncbi:hypothetical protein [Mesorhizobium sp. L-8-3]|uniref:hypothetical protein n=1 Tax=Mesorhizobium sp. L-8-3 TaxID=2744522 RepID=UPI0019267908|nr:hypothetical protein [Mesorhizobium sp. L-8-3]BCH23544.1 hypothetical protein MesoLjLb_33290 [Mesorhizobium sp. L-8-3]
MSKFKDALERGKQARREQKQEASEAVADGDAAPADFNVLARTWLNNVVVASLESAKADVAGEVTIDIDTAPLRIQGAVPSVQFQIYWAGSSRPPRTFTVAVQVDGGVSVSAPGMVAKDAGGIANSSNEHFTNLVADLIEDAAKNS